MQQQDTWWIPWLGYIGSLVAAVWVGVWKISGIDTKRLEGEAALRKEMETAMDIASRNAGEGLAALRQKNTDDQFWNRDNFVRRADFQNTIDSFARSIDAMRVAMDAGYLRLDGKLDRIQRNFKDDEAK